MRCTTYGVQSRVVNLRGEIKISLSLGKARVLATNGHNALLLQSPSFDDAHDLYPALAKPNLQFDLGQLIPIISSHG